MTVSHKFLCAMFIVALFMTVASCKKDSPTAPPISVDTTSHDFAWQTFTWGGGGGSSIQDVAIVNDTDIWAVGGINPPEQDSIGYRFGYGAIHWDGHIWHLLQLPTDQGLTYTSYIQPSGIIAFSPTDIWLASGCGVHRFNGNVITETYWLVPFSGNRIGGIFKEDQSTSHLWGRSSTDIYVVGRRGAIAHFDGTEWTKIESGTTLDFMDIWGEKNATTGEYEILAVAARVAEAPRQTELFRIRGRTATKILARDKAFVTTWFMPEQKYLFGGDALAWIHSTIDTTWHLFPDGGSTIYFIDKLRGNGLNDIFSVGAFMEIAHYNGSTWHNYSNEIPYRYAALSALAVHGNTVVTAGISGQDGLLLLGKRLTN